MTHLKRRSFWTSRRRSHGNDCQLHGAYNTKPPLAEYNALLGHRFQAHFAQDIDPHDASGVALLGSRFATQKEMKWHCKLHSSSEKNADTSCSQSGNQCTQKQAHNKFTWRFFIIWWHVLCSKQLRVSHSLRKDLYTILPCETSHGWKFFWTWRLGQRASVLVAGYTCPAFSGKACWNGCYPSHSSMGLWSKGVGCELHSPNPNRSRKNPRIFYKPKSFASFFLVQLVH